ncbi:MAG: hypothetical protein ABSF64_13665 [Bryobacteraceae bacterium]|jgi:hypothetical protein
MTRGYVKLSLRAGCLAAIIDDALGADPTFLPDVRAHSFDLTPQYLDDMKREALRRGVPAAALDAGEESARQLTDSDFVDLGLRLQAAVDRSN